VDTLLPEMEEEILSVDNVQRATDSGRRSRFRVVVAVGNKNGYVGVGEEKGKEIGPTIRKAIVRAKLNIREVMRACSSWECGCGQPHSIPFTVQGKTGSVRVTIKPAPVGTGLISGEIARKILTLAGIKDARTHTEGHTRTSLNFAHAVFEALGNLNKTKVSQKEIKCLNIISGAVSEKAESIQ
ncbi:MAG: 30S ribosomal protein S5, partial [Candidatus Altiarchaeota archaeon]